jgi:hypothetical protein
MAGSTTDGGSGNEEGKLLNILSFQPFCSDASNWNLGLKSVYMQHFEARCRFAAKSFWGRLFCQYLRGIFFDPVPLETSDYILCGFRLDTVSYQRCFDILR